MARTAYELAISDQLYDQWRSNLCQNSSTARYWFTVFNLEIMLFMFACSIQDEDYQSFIICLRFMTKRMFALDHVHYARCLPVFIEYMTEQSENDEINVKVIFNDLSKGLFTVRKMSNPFSRIDQIHEQNNKMLLDY